MVFRPIPEEAGGAVVRTEFAVLAPAIVLLGAAATWWWTGALLWLVGCRPLRAWKRARWIATAGVAVGLILVGLTHVEREAERPGAVWLKSKPAGSPPAPVRWTFEGMAPTGVTLSQLEELGRGPDGDRELASRILAALAIEGVPWDSRLCVAVSPQAQLYSGELRAIGPDVGFMVLFVDRYGRASAAGSVEFVASERTSGFFVREHAERRLRWLCLRLASSDATKRSYVIQVLPDTASAVGVAFIGLVAITRWACRLVWGQVQVKRLRLGRCPECAYPVRSVP